MKFSKILLGTALCASVSTAAVAATQGTTGATSTGTLDVQVTVLEELKVSNLANITLGTYVAGGGNLQVEDQFCIFYNNSNDISLTLTSTNGTAPAYAMINGADTIPYTVDFQADADTPGPYAAHNSGDTVAYTVFANAANDDCTTIGGPTSAIRATLVDTGSPLPVANGIYTDTITVVVAP